MNQVEMRAAVAAAMQNDNVVDAREMNGIVAQVMANDISPFEINAARSLLRDSNAEVAADAEAVRRVSFRLKHAIRDLNAPEGISALRDKASAEAALASATNRRDAYQTLASTLYANADEGVRTTADQFAGVAQAGRTVGDALQDVGDRLGSAVSHIGSGLGDAIHDLFGHRD